MDFIDAIHQITDGVVFYRDRHNRDALYAEFTDGKNKQHFDRITSECFEAFLRMRYAETVSTEKELNTKRALRYIKDHHLYFSAPPLIDVFIRKAGSLTSDMEYDLLTPGAQVVRITKEGWYITADSKNKFLRPPEALPQVTPQRTSDDLIDLLKPFVNLTGDDLALFAVWLVQNFCDGNRNALLLMAERGSGKSTLARIIRRILDPSLLDITPFPSKIDDLLVVLGNAQLVCFDNVGDISKNQSDILCSAITSSTTAKRTLFSDCALTLQKLRNVVVLNGISVTPKESDLAERFLILKLKKITGKVMRPEREFWADFASKLPSILGAIFDILSRAIHYTENYTVDEDLPRMADSFVDMLIIAQAMGISSGEFRRIYDENVAKLKKARAETPLIEAVREYMHGPGAGKRVFEGTASQVYKAIKSNYSGNHSLLPGSASHFSRKLDSEYDSLRAAGFRANLDDTKPEGTYIRIIRQK